MWHPRCSELVSCKSCSNFSAERESDFTPAISQMTTRLEKSAPPFTTIMRLTKRYGGKNGVLYETRRADLWFHLHVLARQKIVTHIHHSHSKSPKHCRRCDIWFQIILAPPTFFSPGGWVSISVPNACVHKSQAAVNFQRAGRLNTFISARERLLRDTKKQTRIPQSCSRTRNNATGHSKLISLGLRFLHDAVGWRINSDWNRNGFYLPQGACQFSVDRFVWWVSACNQYR